LREEERLNLRKEITVSVTTAMLVVGLIAFCIGVGAGWYSAWHQYIKRPMVMQQKEMEKQQQEMEKMTRRGDVKKVSQNSITINVTAGGEDVGKTLTYAITSTTRVQIGTMIMGGDMSGPAVDVSKYILPGDFVHLMVKDGQAVSMYRALRPGEEPLNSKENQ
jgi:archaellum component FlaF (FlaF/FlaG flagellin family)